MSTPASTLSVLGAAALATALAGALTVPLLQPAPVARVTAQGAVAPTPLSLADESAQVEQRKDHTRATATAAARAAAAEQARRAEEQAAARAAAAREQERASRSRREAAAAAADPRSVARALLAAQGQAGQFGCLDRLWTKESEWRVSATNPSSGAYGIPQSLPASKMASAGSDWRTNARTQIRWGLGYINERYGSPCAAWAHSQSHNWY